MDAKKIEQARRRLSNEYENLIKSIDRNRFAAEEIRIEKTEDECDLAAISHDRDLCYDLHEEAFTRLKLTQEAIKAIDSGRYGECGRCGKDINEKRLLAVPWATLCIRCQEEAEMELTSSRLVLAGLDAEETEF